MLKSHVKELMKTNGETLRSLSEKAGITQHTLIRSRDDHLLESCTLGVLKRIAQALHVEVKDLFSEIKEPPPNA